MGVWIQVGRVTKRGQRKVGLKGRWMTHTVGPISALAVLCVIVLTISFSVYYYSNMQSDLRHRAKTTTDFFANYIGQSYKEYYQSCITYASTFEDRNTIELQFINVNGWLVASSYGQWLAVRRPRRIFPGQLKPRKWSLIRAGIRPQGSGSWRFPAP